ncbi:ATP-binding protein [Aureimonas ureilytica]|uniref:ATP-binding protein n=1 Tax=Aureimonas ureilytica TaxID=401562 RepID=UPI00037A495D|nr:ATP-binding protein [Aureimonas ureilytica]
MAISLGSLTSTRNTKPPIGVLYGIHGVGKTRLASEFPDPYYLPTIGEEPPEGVEMPSPGTAESLDEVLDVIQWLLTEEHDRKTLIVDSLDGLEPLVWAHTCGQNGWNSIEDAGFGKGYVAADAVWREFIGGVQALRDSGVGVILIAHTEITRFDSPTSDPYSRYGIKLHKRASALIQEAAQFVGFMNFRHSLKEKEVGFNKKVSHAEGSGERQVHLEERPGFLAKSRYETPASLSYKVGQGYAALAKFLPGAEN